jgi:hypothetical protein
MGLLERRELYRQIEDVRQRPLVSYVTSNRPGADGRMAGDAVHEFALQLQALPADADALDLLVVSNGGDPTVAWRVVSLIRERVKSFSVLVPAGAFSAATLIALGANRIILHPNGNLGPVDPQIHLQRRNKQDGQPTNIDFGSEDLSAFLTFARDDVGLTDQQYLTQIFAKFCDEVGAVPIGVAARSAQLSLSMAEKLLCMHMSESGQEQQAKTIAEKLSREFYHHGYALSRSEAKEIGLPVEDTDTQFYDLLWRVWLDFVDDLELRTPFNRMMVVHANPDAGPIFGPTPSVTLPPNSPPQVVQAIMQQLAQQAVAMIPPTNYRLIHACLESVRTVSHFVTTGGIFVARQPDFQLKFNALPYRSGWEAVETHGTDAIAN